MNKKLKATKRLTNINFETDGSAVALVSKDQGGSANGFNTILMKATDKISQEDIEKASMVTVTLPITEYLSRFFNLWYDDAELLARVMGYNVDDPSSDPYDYLDEQVAAVSIMKALILDKSEVDINKAVAELSPKDYLTVLKSQELFEKNFDKANADLKKSSSVKTEGVTGSIDPISPKVDLNENKEDVMSKDFITKSVHESLLEEAINKALAPVQAEIEKQKEVIKQYEQLKVEAISKSRKEAIAAVEADKDSAEALFKSLEAVNDEAFEAVMKALKKKEEKLDQSDLLKELGSQGTQVTTADAVSEDNTAKILKAQYPKEGAK